MIIRRFTYNAMLDLISTQAKEILELHNEVRRLKNDNRLLHNILINDPFDVDFPKSAKGGNTANTGNDTINDIFNL